MGGAAGFGQSALPSTSPTAASPAAASPPAVSAAAPAKAAPQHASVVYSRGQLEVSADDSSLNQILRDIARETGMKITGGVTDERVFGKYGPAGASEVLTNLLDGTGSNILLKETADKVPAELILSPRTGGPTPPNPNAPGFDDDSSSSDAVDQPRPAPLPPPPPAVPQTQPGMPPVPDVNGQPPATPPRTPQEIYQQLQQMQQQQQLQRQQQQRANPQ
jgi:hypothetical protein